MERWELDMLAGKAFNQLGETNDYRATNLRFTQVNSRSVTHWLGDNKYDENPSYGFIQ